MLTRERLKRFAPNARAGYVNALLAAWPEMQEKHGINTPLRLAHFLVQGGTETGLFTILQENLNYTAQRLVAVFPRYFPTLDDARPYVHNPEKLANYVYDDAHRPPSSRLGNTKRGDGWKYRGRSFMQTTGRENYRRIGYEDNPDALLDPVAGLEAALEEWTRGRCNAMADADNLRGIRKKINGGLNGIDEAERLLPIAKRIFTDDDMLEAPDWESAQEKLKVLGYDPGGIDGKLGTLTKAALLAFKADNNLPLTLDLDKATSNALLTASPRPIAKERAEATIKDLREQGSTTIAATDAIKAAGGTMATTGVIAGAVKESGILDTAKQAGEIAGQVNDAVVPVKGLFASLAGMMWVPLVIGGVVIIWFAVKIAKQKLAKYRAGQLS